jgi:S1-C subfamily serine protease
VGHGGVILHTEDGGNTWTQEKSGSDADLMSVCVVKPYGVLGMQLENVTSGTGKQEHIVRDGALIDSVVPNSPSEKAGLMKGDIIVSLNGQPVKDTTQFIEAVFVTKPGTGVTVGFLRKGKAESTNAIVADGSKPFPSAPNP